MMVGEFQLITDLQINICFYINRISNHVAGEINIKCKTFFHRSGLYNDVFAESF